MRLLHPEKSEHDKIVETMRERFENLEREKSLTGFNFCGLLILEFFSELNFAGL